jgi:Arc/MetJ family transcription regulator
MARRTTIEIDEALLARARRALGGKTTRATVEEALRRAAAAAEDEQAERAERQRAYLGRLSSRADLRVLGTEEMWR